METAGSSPKPFMDTLKGAGCLVMHKIPDSPFRPHRPGGGLRRGVYRGV